MSERGPEYWADWLVDAVATVTQNRALLKGEPEADDVLIEAIRMNGLKAIQLAIAHHPSLSISFPQVQDYDRSRDPTLMGGNGGY